MNRSLSFVWLFFLAGFWHAGQAQCTLIVSDPNPCAGEEVSFSVENPDPDIQYTWDLNGDGQADASGSSTNYTFPRLFTEETYAIVLLADGNSCSSTQIIVRASPDATVGIPPGIVTLIGNEIKACNGAGVFELSFFNASATFSNNVSYRISWGDGSPAETFDNTTFSQTGTISHTYSGFGYYTIFITAEHQNGCLFTENYIFYNGGNPSVGIVIPGNTVGLCAPATLDFPISNTAGNPPGTEYRVYINGTEVASFTQENLPPVFTYTFEESSCGQTTSTGNYQNAFDIKIVASNPCNSSTATIEPIEVSSPPEPLFEVSPPAFSCTGAVYGFTNISTNINEVISGNPSACVDILNPRWTITGQAGTDWNVVSGNLFSSNNIQIEFLTPGVYTITMTLVSFSCGPVSFSQQITVYEPPEAGAGIGSVDPGGGNGGGDGCAPLNISFGSTTQGADLSYQWGVVSALDWAFADSLDVNSPTPTITFLEGGAYDVFLLVTNPCATVTWDTTVVLPGPPSLQLGPIPDSCASATLRFDTLNVRYTENGFPITAYSWAFDGATPDTASVPFPAGIKYDSAGTYIVQLSAVNACGSSMAADTFIVQEMTILSLPEDRQICSSESPFILDASPAGGIWSGAGITPEGLFDPSRANTGENVLTYRYGTGACFLEDDVSIHIIPAASIQLGPDQTLCVNDPDQTLGAMPMGGTWSISGNGQLAGDTFLTSASGVGKFSLIYSFTDGNNCQVRDSFSIEVLSVPEIIVADSSYCDMPGATHLPQVFPGGGTWAGPGVVDPVAGLFDPGVAGGAGNYVVSYVVVADNGCSSQANINIGVIDPVSVNAGPDRTLCLYDAALSLSANANPSGGTWSGAGLTGGVFTAEAAGPGQHLLFYRVGAGNCSVTDSLRITVVAPPTAAAGPDLSICALDPAFVLDGQSPAGGSWSGEGLADTQTGLFDPGLITPDTYVLTYSVIDQASGCESRAARQITLHPSPTPAFDLPELACVNQVITIGNQSEGATRFHWDLGNGTASESVSPTVQYPVEGAFPVRLNVENDYGCLASLVREIQVAAPPRARFTPDSREGCGRLDIQITNQSEGYQPDYHWDFGNGQTGTTASAPGPIQYKSGVNDTVYVISLALSNVCGTDIWRDTILVRPLPEANFGFTVDTGCAPLTVAFANISTGSPEGFLWDFGNGQTSTDSLPGPQTFGADTIPVIYSITLITTNRCGADTLQRPLVVHPEAVNAFFNVDNTTGCAPFRVQLENFSTPGTVINWDFGDGNMSATPDPVHLFEEAGTYLVKQRVANACASDSSTMTITVLPKPEVSFEHSSNLCRGQEVRFTNTSPSGLGSIRWIFGTGDSSLLTNPVYVFPDTGTFTVTLIGSAAGNTCRADTSIRLSIGNPPEAVFSLDERSGCAPLSVQFDPSGSTGNFLQWDFGDGNTSVEARPLHVFGEAGSYEVRLRVSDMAGCSVDTVISGITVFPVPVAGFAIRKDADCGLPARVSFINESVDADGYLWHFGEGLTSSLVNPSQTFYQSGPVGIGLEARNVYGCRDSFFSELTLYEAPVADFGLDSIRGCAPLPANFVNYGQGDRFHWDFGDGVTSTERQAQHLYRHPGRYDVVLIAAVADLCFDTMRLSGLVEVLNTPRADFEWLAEMLNGAPTGLIRFINRSQDAQVYFWDFGDGASTGEENPTHRYYENGAWQVYLQAANQESGCTDDTLVVLDAGLIRGLFVPNAFAPDQGLGDARIFLPKGIGLKEYRLQIFSPYGELLWESTALEEGQPAEGWDGMHHGHPLPQDVYVWKVQAVFEDGTEWRGMKTGSGGYQRIGSVTLIR